MKAIKIHRDFLGRNVQLSDRYPPTFWICVGHNSLTYEQLAASLATKLLESPHYLCLETAHGEIFVLDAVISGENLWILVRPPDSTMSRWYEMDLSDELFIDVRDRFCYLMSI